MKKLTWVLGTLCLVLIVISAGLGLYSLANRSPTRTAASAAPAATTTVAQVPFRADMLPGYIELVHQNLPELQVSDSRITGFGETICTSLPMAQAVDRMDVLNRVLDQRERIITADLASRLLCPSRLNEFENWAAQFSGR